MLEEVIAAKPENAEVLASLGATTFYETFRPYNTEGDIQAYIQKAYQVEDIRQKLGAPDQYYYAILWKEDQPVGYLKLILQATHPVLSSKVIELEKIYVLKSQHGVGQLLMDEAIRFAKQQQADQLFLGVWNENHRAVAFYKRNGFEVFDTRQFQLGSRLCEDYMMRLVL
jgi:ribosomal protein S18 acetylase RimI-like enzyme